MRYTKNEEIERGAYGTVYSAFVNDETTNQRLEYQVAVKAFDYDDCFEEELVAARCTHGHRFFAQFIEAIEFQTLYCSPTRNKSIVYELAECDLHEFARKKENRNQPPRGIVEFMVGAIEYLRSNNLAHRDIKDCNILVFRKEDGGVEYKLGDIGSLVRLGESPEFSSLPLIDFPMVRCTYRSMPKFMKKRLKKIDRLLYHEKDNLIQEVRWLDIYCAMNVIHTIQKKFVQPDDPVMDACARGLAAETYAECEAAWKALVDAVVL